MTLGLTGVIWLPRGATVNSTTLISGAGPVPLSTASAAWGALAGAFTDAHTTLLRVTAELAAGWQGTASVAAIAKITPFTIWTAECIELAADTAAKAGFQAGAYTTAALVMPSIPEIVAVKTAKTTAYSTGGALNGTAAVAEAADRAMDIRAGIVMETYEAASNVLALKRSFRQPPRIVTSADAESSKFDDAGDWERDPVGAGLAALAAAGQNPALTTAASQAGSVATSAASTATSAVGNIGGAAYSASQSSQSMMPGAPMLGGLGGAGNGAASTSAMSHRGGVGAVGAIGGAALPEGWGKVDGTQGARGPAGGAPGVLGGEMRTDAAGTRPAAGGSMMPARPVGAHGSSDDGDERDTPDYLKNFEHFADGRTVIPSVIGGTPDQRGSR
ncbi:PPE family protein [Rhodococcus triatomae]|uniref:PPE family protein n=1 Tax=Rhodococcus triatomae TaxID=300028 RepID=A0A1G8HWF2_9NOCA|nr:PPE family protein [Rhodococcus triatomae]QNG20895.1 PPE family protein [Rhodococcus triatomae]QNG23190.1 PPE family protein [Rhodococcus triatomae]SDI10862.1 PPE family protein [Rhodococcus triatomae]